MIPIDGNGAAEDFGRATALPGMPPTPDHRPMPSCLDARPDPRKHSKTFDLHGIQGRLAAGSPLFAVPSDPV
jgi:hypothetical protein